MLFLGQNLRSRLDLLKPNIRKYVQDKQSSAKDSTKAQTRVFNIGQKVLARDYRGSNQKWQSGKILSRTGPLTYTIDVGTNLVWCRHFDQILDSETHMVSAQPGSTCTAQDSDEFPVTTSPEVQGLCDVTDAQSFELPTQSHKDSSEKVRCYPERNRRAPQRLDV